MFLPVNSLFYEIRYQHSHQFREKDFKLVILICPTTPEVEVNAYEQVLRIVRRAQLNAETYL